MLWCHCSMKGPKESFHDFLARAPYNNPDQGALVGVSDSPCTKGSLCTIQLCGKITTPTESGEQVVQCKGRAGRYLVVQLPGKSRMINFREVVACEHATAYTFDRHDEHDAAPGAIEAEMKAAIVEATETPSSFHPRGQLSEKMRLVRLNKVFSLSSPLQPLSTHRHTNDPSKNA